jgi:branched-chain amino acid transport system permease protein
MSIAIPESEPKTVRRSALLKSPRTVLCLGGLAAVCVLPLFLSDYQVFQLTLVLVMAIAILGVNLVTGYNGQISLGHGAFYAIGAYVTAILMAKGGIPYWATLPVSAVVCLSVGFLFGFPALRLGGHNLALATFALAVATPQILKSSTFEAWTGGVQGIPLAKPVAPFGLPLNEDRWLYFFTLSIAVVLFLAAYNLIRGRTGRAIVAIRENQLAAEAMGINTALYKALIFGISAMYTGLAGSLGAIVVQYVAPDSFNVFLSISLLIGGVVGGIASISGALYGAAFLQFIPDVTDSLSKAAPWAIYGLILILFMRFMPEGIAGFVGRLSPRRNARVAYFVARIPMLRAMRRWLVRDC